MIYDRVLSTAVTCNTTGNATWTAAATQHALPPTGISSKWVNYTLLDSAGTKWETGRTTLSESAGTYTLTRGGSQIVTESSNSGSAESFTNSSAHTLFVSPDAQFFNNAEILLESKLASASASIDFDLPAGFKEYRVRVLGLVPVVDNVDLYLKASTDAGSTYLNTAADYYWRAQHWESDATEAETSSKTSTTGATLLDDLGSGSTESAEFEIVLTNFASTAAYKLVRCDAAYVTEGGEARRVVGVASIRATSAVDNVKFDLSSGNISSGTFKLYGIVE